MALTSGRQAERTVRVVHKEMQAPPQEIASLTCKYQSRMAARRQSLMVDLAAARDLTDIHSSKSAVRLARALGRDGVAIATTRDEPVMRSDGEARRSFA